ncbi:WecB/TagA/CpsF family glycosyltransferase, partial [Patescibacteria group bacterium]|nr:WecB/TagA/CpsF family glycosyltransferase [Patescibacteria group bacterium]
LRLSTLLVLEIRKQKKVFIITPNPEILTYASTHPDFKNTLNSADLALCDGVGLLLAGKLLGKSLKQRMAGVDFVKNVCREASESNSAGAKKPITVGFLGARGSVAERASDCLQKMYPGLKVSFAKEELKEGEKVSVDILFVAYGFPKQEEWIASNLERLDIRAAMGVGGSLDYISGEVKRAPSWIRKIGLEWLYRLFRQPWRIKRQASLIKFAALILKEKFT